MSELDSDAPLAPFDKFPEYRLVRPLGRGAMGEVYLAHDPLLDRPVAIKFIAQLDPDPHARERFFTEARAVARLTHPNVVSVYRVGEWAGRPFLVSEFVRGQSLDRLKKPLPSAEVLRLGIGLARGLGAAHRRGVLHRDIKPANAILGEDGEVKLLDFGLAKILDGSGESGPPAPVASPDLAALEDMPSAATLSFHDTGEALPPRPAASPGGSGLRLDATAPGSILGSPLYMAPEVWAGEQASRRSDVYSLGILLYELCAGRAPHHGVSFLTLSRLVRETDVPPVAQAAPGVDPRLGAVIDRCVRRGPAERYESGDALREALESLEQDLRAPPAQAASLPKGNPYRGLATFEEADRALFFGRGREVRAVLDRLRAEPFVLVAGDSGVGKSSLCRAGVLPQLPGAVARMVPGRHPAAALRAMLTPLLGDGDGEAEGGDALADPAALGRRLRLRHPEGVVLFIDQMEELLTLADPAEAATVGEVLDLLLSTTPGLRLLGTVRGDFITRLATLPGLGPDVSRALFLLGPLQDEALTDAIAQPARAFGYAFESPALVATLAASAGADEGGLPLLQFALAELWEARDPERRIIPAAALHAMGGVSGALARHADGVLAQLLPAQREAARRIFGRLITAEGTRARRSERELCGEAPGDPDARAALSALVQGRLLVARSAPPGEGGSAYELAHEALLSGWGTLKGWLLSDMERRLARQRLEQAAAEWERLGRSPELLFRDRQLDEVQPLQREPLPPREVAFLRAAQRARRRRRLVRYGLIAGGPLGLALIYGGALLAERRARGQQVAVHLREARAALGEARRQDAEGEARRKEALRLFDARERGGGEAIWEQALGTGREAGRAYELASRRLEAALTLDSARRDVRELLAEALYERVLLAERLHHEEAQEELRARLALYDDSGLLQARLERPAALRVRTSPPGAALALLRYEAAADGRRRPVPVGAAPEPDGALRLRPGSYLLTATAAGRPALRYPIQLGRGEARELRLDLPSADQLPRGFVYVPPGRFLFGSGDDESLRRFFNAVPLHPVETPPYLIAQRETTFADWIAYLRALPEAERAARWPRAAPGLHGSLELRAQPGGAFELVIQPATQPLVAKEGEPLRYPGRSQRAEQDWLRAPVVGVSWEDAQAYAAWLDRSGRVPGARLCTEQEWERAARGADDRLFPHGDRLLPEDANFDRSYGRQPLGFGPDEVGTHPASRSPFGLDDMTGNVWEWVISSVSAREAVARGGGYYHTDRSCAVVNRQESEPTARNAMIGLRLCATWRGPVE